MQKIEQRIERLEQRQTPERDMVEIFVGPLLAPGQVPIPVAGWSFADGQRVMRLHGESDEQLQERAIATARPAGSGCVLAFYQVIDNEGAQP